MIPQQRQDNYKMILKYFFIPESRGVFQTNTTDREKSQGYRSYLGGAFTVLAWNNLNTSVS